MQRSQPLLGFASLVVLTIGVIAATPRVAGAGGHR